MKRIILIFIFSPFFISAQEKNDQENFNLFVEKFYADSTFQFSRIIFPLKGSEVGIGDYIPQDIADSLGIEVEVRTKWKKYEFNRKLYSVVDYGEDYQSEYTVQDDCVEEKLYLNASGYFEIRRFELIGKKWFLTYFFLNNL